MVNKESAMDMAYRLLQEGKSKGDIGRVIGADKKQVAKLLAKAIKAKGERNVGID